MLGLDERQDEGNTASTRRLTPAGNDDSSTNKIDAPINNLLVDAHDEAKRHFPVLAAYDQCLKCSHLFNVLDSRGVISTTERAQLIGRVRQIACRVAADYLGQQTGAATSGAKQ